MSKSPKSGPSAVMSILIELGRKRGDEVSRQKDDAAFLVSFKDMKSIPPSRMVRVLQLHVFSSILHTPTTTTQRLSSSFESMPNDLETAQEDQVEVILPQVQVNLKE